MWDKIIEWFGSRDNVTFLIAVAGFLMSIYNFFRAMWDKRCSLRKRLSQSLRIIQVTILRSTDPKASNSEISFSVIWFPFPLLR